MIGWEEVYKVVVAMAPLYVALALGYFSVRRWHMFKPDQCDAINRFNCFFVIPFFNFQFMAHINPYHLNYPFLSADAVAKTLVIAALAAWANFTKKGSLSCSVTAFSLSTLTNTLIVGVPLLRAMYGDLGADLVVQAAVIQNLVWFTFLLFALQFWFTRTHPTTSSRVAGAGAARDSHGSSVQMAGDVEANNNNETNTYSDDSAVTESTSVLSLMMPVLSNLAQNPNSYACFLGLFWALLASRWDLQLPSIIEGSIVIMSKAGSGVAMFSMGLFIALQENIVECGASVTALAMVLRFIVGPATTLIGCLVLGLRGDVLRISLIQAALPQSLASFVYAKEYGLHADILSTAVTIGTLVSVPLLITYYVILGFLH
ncbi:PREDICTED: auxin efflux carrier component 5-like isoform X2 [Ipomoea nil]|nr:PREDICTED: auxin efflux carrier component 5-like isoform X2 [Ipomoea nil]